MLANGLSFLRILLVPVVLASLHRDGDQASATTLALILLASATDFLDGQAARRLGQVSRAGRILDPLADKVFVGAICAGLVLWRDLPLWLLVAQVVRDLAIVAAGFFLFARRNIVVSASLWGKAATTVVALTILAFVIHLPQLLKDGLVTCSAGLMAISAVDYGRQFVTILREPADVATRDESS
ncbi:MAG: CDP-alcohol phosphatidyltransferase family protein [Candidatus Latescibacterota bacterium]|nr:CDP-alcohol phosphatidyltransferase family protein [Candidatus Latescibacterota bacterium]